MPLPEEMNARHSHLRRGSYWGRQRFAEQVLKLIERSLGRRKSRAYGKAAVSQAHGLEKAERWLQEGLAAAGLTDKEELLRARGSDPRKVVLATLLWRRRQSHKFGWQSVWRCGAQLT